MIEVEFIDREPGEIVKDDPSCLHVADGIRAVEQDDASIDLFEQGQQFAVPSQGIDGNLIVLSQQIVIGADPADAVGRGLQDDRKDEFALDEAGAKDSSRNNIG